MTLHNFMSYKDVTTIDFSSFDLACLYGENGSGKSTILEAITFALWNKARASADSLIHHKENNMWVDFVFIQDKKTYRIIRKRSRKKRGTSELDFLVDDNGFVSVSGATIKETEEKIAEVIKLPYEIFVNSAYLRQGHADEFTQKPPSQRKEILGTILNLNYYEILSQKAREKFRGSEIEEETLLSSIYEIEETLKQKSSFSKELKEAKKNLIAKENLLNNEEKKFNKMQKEKNKIDLLKQKIENIQNQINSIKTEGRELKIEINKNKNEIENLENLLSKSKKINTDFENLLFLKKENEKFNAKLQQLSAIKEKLGNLKGKKEDIQSRIKKIKAISTCPTCLRILTKKEAEKIIIDLSKINQKEIQKPLYQIQEKIKKLSYNYLKHQKIKEKINQLSDAEEQKRMLDLAAQSLSEKKVLRKKLLLNLNNKWSLYKKLESQQNETNRHIILYKPLEKRYLELESKINELRNNLYESKEVYGAFSQRLTELERQEEIQKQKKQKLEDLQKQTAIYKSLAEIFSKKGLQTLIIETILPEIEDEANRLLEKITNGRMSISFLTSKEKKTGEGEIETLDIKITDNFGQRDYSLYSGGEAFRIDLAIRIALSKVLSKRAGTNLQFLAIDEGFGSLDSTGKDEVVETIMALKGDFAKILVVTHLDELKNLFETKIEVKKDENGSRISIS